jgi:hypothetical protein
MQREILHPCAKRNGDVRVGLYCIEERRLQVAAMDDPVRRAVTPLRRFSKRRARQHASGARVHHAQLLRQHHMRLQSVMKTKRDQDARGVRRELDAGARLSELLGLLEQQYLKSPLCDR